MIFLIYILGKRQKPRVFYNVTSCCITSDVAPDNSKISFSIYVYIYSACYLEKYSTVSLTDMYQAN